MKVYYTATVNSVALTVVSVNYADEMFAPGDFEILVKNDKGLKPQTNYDTCIGAAGVSGQGVDVVISRKGTTMFTGVCDNVKIGNNLIRISGKGEAIKLTWDSCTAWQEYLTTAANTVMTNLLSGTVITLDSSDFTSDINVGYQEGENKYRALYGLVKNYLAGECYVSGGKFFAKTAMGTDKSATITLEHGVNILNLTREVDSFSLANSVKTKGVGEGTFELTSGPATDATSISAYGNRDLIYDAKRVYNQSELDSIKTNLLAKLKDPTDSLEKVLFLDKGDYGLGVGDTTTVTNSRLGVSGGYRIFEIRRQWDRHGEIVTATLSNNSRSIEKEIADISYKVDIQNFYPQGNPMWIPIELPFTSLDVDEAISHEFVIPDTGDWKVNINDGEISVFSDRYRIWSKGAASEGASIVEETDFSGSLGPNITTSWSTVRSNAFSNDTAKVGVLITGKFSETDPANIGVLLDFRLKKSSTYYPASGGVTLKIERHRHGESGGSNTDYELKNTFTAYLEAPGNFNGDTLEAQIKADRNVTLETVYVHMWGIGLHTHDPEPGIYEFTGVWPVDVEVWVNGTKVADKNSHGGLAGGSKFTVRNIDILSELQTGANKILLKSTGANSKGTLSMSGGARIFVRSKG